MQSYAPAVRAGTRNQTAVLGGKGHLSTLQSKEKEKKGPVADTVAAEGIGRGSIPEIVGGGLNFAGIARSVELKSLLCLKDEFVLQKLVVVLGRGGVI